ncbi:MAG: DUF4250 domain-containing protein [Anaerostipes sp.]|jgi:hypothetical protein|nr:DUF4250 domain-containing protein [Anaerostipes sp.]MDD3745615.1 DUF4250 domain-containing protein [Anaerostipes sp.]
MLPKDPVILLSYVNTQLRDYDEDFHEMCQRLMVEPDSIAAKLNAMGYEYDNKRNQFK